MDIYEERIQPENETMQDIQRGASHNRWSDPDKLMNNDSYLITTPSTTTITKIMQTFKR